MTGLKGLAKRAGVSLAALLVALSVVPAAATADIDHSFFQNPPLDEIRVKQPAADSYVDESIEAVDEEVELDDEQVVEEDVEETVDEAAGSSLDLQSPEELAPSEGEPVAAEDAAGAPSLAEELGDDVSGSVYNWERIWGKTALDTMRAVVQTDGVFAANRGGTVLIAKLDTYQDALSAAGLAGLYGAPILITDGKSLSNQTKLELQRLKPKFVGIIGGKLAITENVEKQIKNVVGSSVTVDRAFGPNAAITSVYVYKSGYSYWNDTAIIATGNSYKDALSIAPFAYWYGAPIFLANNDKKNPDNRVLCSDVLDSIKYGSFKRVIIVGGTSAVSYKVEGQIKNLGTGATVTRLWGKDAILTSKAIAEWELKQGMGITHMAVATTKSHKDALCAVPLCGEQASILVLMHPNGGVSAFNAVYKSSSVYHGHVIGGTSAISNSNWNHITTR